MSEGGADERYGESYFKDTFGVDGLSRFSMHWWSARLYAGVARWCLSRYGGRRVLEIGCGHGFILSLLEERFETFGVDLSAYAIEQCARNAPRSRCAVADLEAGLPEHLEAGSFDLVLGRYVLEHLTEPAKVLAALYSLLKPGGTLFYAVPNTESIGARWKGPDWYALLDPTHCSLLEPERWLALTREAGFAIEREFADGYWDLPYWRGVPRLLQAPLFLGPSALACLVARPLLPARFGENILVIARKPEDGDAADRR